MHDALQLTINLTLPVGTHRPMQSQAVYNSSSCMAEIKDQASRAQ